MAGDGDRGLDGSGVDGGGGSGVERLPAALGSLARGVWPTAPGSVVARSVDGGVRAGPRSGRAVLFGRHVDQVHVRVGVDDRRVSRHQGTLTCDGACWWLQNAGRSPIRLSERLLFPGADPVPLAEGYTPVFVPGSGGREHLLEVYVVGADRAGPSPQHSEPAVTAALWPLSADERLALVVLGQRYLLHEPNPQPLTRKQAADQLAELQPAAGWSTDRIEYVMVRVRARLSEAGVPELTCEDVPKPDPAVIDHNLITELVHSTTLVPPDLRSLDID